MAPMYMGINGIDHLNQELQSIFNPKSSDKEEIKYGDVIFREQDKILQLVNMPDLNVYNGDIGYISSIIPSTRSESKKNEIYVNYDGNIVKYLPNDFQKIKHGFIISIHKSQGSEFEFVIMPICRYYRRMLYKKLIYTGITRAKRKLILLGEADAFLYGVSNTNEMVRKTNLKNRLEKMYNMDNISVK
jgi:exodeoxyribonuclease V alpha subunit